MNPVLTVEEAADVLRCTPATVMEELRSGNLPGVKIGKEWVIPTEAFYARLNELAVAEMKFRRETRIPEGAVLLPRPRIRRHPLIASFTTAFPPNPSLAVKDSA